MVAVFLPVVQAVDAPPYDFLLTSYRPCTSAVRCSALPAHEQLGKGIFTTVFTLLGGCADLLDLSLSGSSGEFLLHPVKGGGINDRRVVIFYIVLHPLSCVDAFLFADAVDNVSLAQQGIALVFLIGENGLYHAWLPDGSSHRCGDAAFCQLLGNLR